ncbi:MAG: hypothetical protein MUC54_06040, partial [Chloroflexi bacterium]|nr:hypothetical protein [Chloroflexota bacterium]
MPAPDPVAADYLLLALRLDQHLPGLVDGYLGPADLKARVDMEPLTAPAQLLDDAIALRARVAVDVADPVRRRWLEAQSVALETQARALAGEPLPYEAHVAACFDLAPTRTPEATFTAAAEALDRLLPGAGPLAARIAAWDEAFTVPVDRLRAVVDVLLARFRDRAAGTFGLPEGERLAVSFVRDQPWSGYNWYDGDLRSRIDLNLDLPVRAPDLLTVLPHETYPGHHLEHAWKEAILVEREGRLEHSVLLINA